MEELIKIRCEEYGINPNILTPEERKMLCEEIKAEQRGMSILDGVLSNPELYYRGLKKFA